MAKISTLILAKNEERNMADCIASVAFSDEILVIDDFSTDRTKGIAESLGARVIQRAMNGDWGGQQTFAIQAATCEWVFFIDADERVSEPLAREIRATVETGERNAYWSGSTGSATIMPRTASCARIMSTACSLPKVPTSKGSSTRKSSLPIPIGSFRKRCIIIHTTTGPSIFIN